MKLASLLIAVSASRNFLTQACNKMPPNPNPYFGRNADGSRTPLIQLLDQGESSGQEVTLDGFVVSSVNGTYMYMELADQESGGMVSSGLIVGLDNPRTTKSKKSNKKLLTRNQILQNNAAFHKSKWLHQRALITQVEKENGIPNDRSHVSRHRRRAAVIGKKVNLIVPFKFSDQINRAVPSTDDLFILMNNEGPHTLCPTGSLRDVYLISSYNQLVLDSTIAPWVTLPNSEAYYADGNSGLTTLAHIMVRDALNALEATGFDFKNFDMNNDSYVDTIGFLHSGYGAEWGGLDAFNTSYKERIWSHQGAIWSLPGGQWTSASGIKVYNYYISPSLWSTSGSAIGRIGVIAHETGHFFGLPDLYDGAGGTGIGSYCLMSNPWGMDASQYLPPVMSAWAKYQLGWVTPILVTTSGLYTTRQACSYPDVLKISKNFPIGEYLLIENRQKCNFDSKLLGPGLAIFHVDELASLTSEGYPGQMGWPTNGNHYQVSLLQADGKYDLEKGQNRGDATDLFSGVGVSSISSAGTSTGVNYPNTNAYQGGIIKRTGISISNITSSSGIMSFVVNFDDLSPTMAPILPSENVLEISLLTDQYSSKDTYWDLFQKTLKGLTLVASKPVGSYANNLLYKEKYFLDTGTYQLDFKDVYGDGLRSPGFFKISVGGEILKTVGSFNKLDSTTFIITKTTDKPSLIAPASKPKAPASEPTVASKPTGPMSKLPAGVPKPAVTRTFPTQTAPLVQPYKNAPRPSKPVAARPFPTQKAPHVQPNRNAPRPSKQAAARPFPMKKVTPLQPFRNLSRPSKPAVVLPFQTQKVPVQPYGNVPKNVPSLVRRSVGRHASI
jgi:M6 family metalloprotease-like protein